MRHLHCSLFFPRRCHSVANLDDFTIFIIRGEAALLPPSPSMADEFL
jgi:hypothetical protein